MDITDSEFEAANRRGAEMLAKFPAAVAVRYDSASARLIILLSNGQHIAVAPPAIRGLEKAQPEDLIDAQISPYGQGIYFPKIDADIYLPALLLSTASP
ncbi:DUF2442 domain-containing protein [Pseudoduganella sp. FT25W]|uniref:DUF2442 domain-containing protein n=1 Tax=Duganella alba TaxID=2666081 RepID=A0A6L5QPM1_9BURK|nr:DUF2442 domain-containing protein [Duganella alba]MRX11278.1 DUF2442 domain-containing protein [Duganella alba]MRX19150.1 DUF2442 domain-containing protein [Duganella alba]